MNFTWQGQSCSSTSRLFLHDAIYDEVRERIVKIVRAIHPGDPFSPGTKMGAINSKAQLEKVKGYVELAKSFFEGPEPGFVNGALDAVAQDVRS